MPEDISAAVLKQCISNDHGAWEQFVRRYSRLIWSSIHKTFKSASFKYASEDVEDIYSSLFLSIVEDDFNKLRQFQARNACSLSTWLVVVTVRKTIDHMRKQQALSWMDGSQDMDRIADTVADPGRNIESRLIEDQSKNELEQSINMLSSSDREVYDQLFHKGLSPEIAARNLGASTSVVYTRKHRLIEKIRKMLVRV